MTEHFLNNFSSRLLQTQFYKVTGSEEFRKLRMAQLTLLNYNLDHRPCCLSGEKELQYVSQLSLGCLT